MMRHQPINQGAAVFNPCWQKKFTFSQCWESLCEIPCHYFCSHSAGSPEGSQVIIELWWFSAVSVDFWLYSAPLGRPGPFQPSEGEDATGTTEHTHSQRHTHFRAATITRRLSARHMPDMLRDTKISVTRFLQLGFKPTQAAWWG